MGRSCHRTAVGLVERASAAHCVPEILAETESSLAMTKGRLPVAMLVTIVALGGVSACRYQAEPRWLVRAFPGSYPEIVYFVPTERRSIAMTIDDGVDPATTPVILDVLKEYGATATFFLISESVSDNEQLIRRVIDEGHEIGHHMTSDEVTVRLPEQELAEKFQRASEVLGAFGHIQWFRPGSARYNDHVLELTRAAGYRIALASVAPVDTLITNPTTMANYINWMVQPGSVVVLHDVGKRGARTAQTLELVLPKLINRGYSVLSLGELDRLNTHQPKPDQ